MPNAPCDAAGDPAGLIDAIAQNTESLNRLSELFAMCCDGQHETEPEGLAKPELSYASAAMSPLGATGLAYQGGAVGAGALSAAPSGTDPRVAAEVSATEKIKSAWTGLGDMLSALQGKRVQNEKDALLSIVGMTLKSTKALGKIQKAYAIGFTVIKTAEGVQRAFADLPFPANLAQAALVTAKGAANVAAIKGQFHAGIASVPATGTYLLERGERVVDRRLNADLKGYLKARTDTPAGPTINMTIHGTVDENSVQRTQEGLVNALREAYGERGMISPL